MPSVAITGDTSGSVCCENLNEEPLMVDPIYKKKKTNVVVIMRDPIYSLKPRKLMSMET